MGGPARFQTGDQTHTGFIASGLLPGGGGHPYTDPFLYYLRTPATGKIRDGQLRREQRDPGRRAGRGAQALSPPEAAGRFPECDLWSSGNRKGQAASRISFENIFLFREGIGADY